MSFGNIVVRTIIIFLDRFRCCCRGCPFHARDRISVKIVNRPPFPNNILILWHNYMNNTHITQTHTQNICFSRHSHAMFVF